MCPVSATRNEASRGKGISTPATHIVLETRNHSMLGLIVVRDERKRDATHQDSRSSLKKSPLRIVDLLTAELTAMLLRIGHGATRVCTVLPKNTARLVVAMGKGKGKSSSSSAGQSSSSGVKQPAYEFNTDGSRVLDRGVWKEFKTCAFCQRIFVNRKAFEKNWSEGRYRYRPRPLHTRSLTRSLTRPRSLARSLARQ